MTMKIFKYPLSESGVVTLINAPIVKPLRVELQRGQLCLWAVVDVDAPSKDYAVLCVGTGGDIPEGWSADNFINTTLLSSGDFVFHWFFREVKGG